MKYQKIKKYDVANGPGLRTTIYFTGCSVRCKGCFNYELWNPDTGIEFTDKTKQLMFNLLSDEHCSGLSILGGEPSDHDDELSEFLKEVKEKFPNKNIWMWSGYTLHQLIEKGRTKCFEYIDVLVDGPFKEELKDLSLKFRGSSNQHIWKHINNIWAIQE